MSGRRLIPATPAPSEYGRRAIVSPGRTSPGRSAQAPGRGGASPGRAGFSASQLAPAFAAIASAGVGTPVGPVGASYSAAVLLDSPKAFWKCQDASGLPVDSSGNGFTITNKVAGPTYAYQVAGPFTTDFGIEVNGGGYFSLNTISTVTANFTMEFWIRPITLTNAAQLMFLNGVGASNGYAVNGDGPARTYNGQADGVLGLPSSTTALTLNGWQLVHVLRRATQWEYYRNGVQDATNPGTTTPNAPSGGMTAFGNPAGAALHAQFAYVAFYETALTAARIAAHSAATRP